MILCDQDQHFSHKHNDDDQLTYLKSCVTAVSLPPIGEQVWVLVFTNTFQPRHLVHSTHLKKKAIEYKSICWRL